KSPLEYGFVEDTVAELAKKLTGKTADLAAGTIYKFTEDDKGEKVVTAASLIGPSKTIYVSAFKAKVSVKIKTITAIQKYVAVGKPYDAATPVNDVPIAMDTSPTNYMAAVKKALADKVAATLEAGPDPEGGAPYRIFKADNAATDIAETDLGTNNTVYVAKKQKVKAKITLLLLSNATGKITANSHDLKDRTVIKPTDSDGKEIFTAVGAAGKEEESTEVYEITEEVFKPLAEKIMAIIKDAGELGTKAGKYALFKGDNPGVNATGYITDITYSDFSGDDLTNVKVYIGYIKS
ncbi:MAG: hypothetical protein ACTTI3_03985, partial [Treponema sp.]